MMRYCNGQDPNLVKEDGKTPCNCKAFFNDEYWMVVYPHKQVNGSLQLRPKTLNPRNRPR